jgi:hypothetical protein
VTAAAPAPAVVVEAPASTVAETTVPAQSAPVATTRPAAAPAPVYVQWWQTFMNMFGGSGSGTNPPQIFFRR